MKIMNECVSKPSKYLTLQVVHDVSPGSRYSMNESFRPSQPPLDDWTLPEQTTANQTKALQHLPQVIGPSPVT
jgi:hypothetical protein